MQTISSFKFLRAIWVSCLFIASNVASSQDSFTTPVSLSGQPVVGNEISEHKISPDGKYVVYLQQRASDGREDLFSVPIGGGVPTRLTANLSNEVAGNSSPSIIRTYFSVDDGFIFSPDGRSLLFLAGLVVVDRDTTPAVQRFFDLYSVPIQGGDLVRLNGDLVNGGSVKRDAFAVSADSTRVVYVADQRTDNVSELFSVSINGGDQIVLNQPLPAGSDVSLRSILLTNTNEVFYAADVDISDAFRIYKVPLEGGEPVLVSPASAPNFGISTLLITPNGSRLIYTSDRRIDRQLRRQLVSIATDGSSFTILNTGADVDVSFRLSPNGARVVYRDNNVARTGRELFSVPTNGGTPVRLSTDMASAPGVNDFVILADGQRVVYLRNQSRAEGDNLLSVPITGGTPMPLNFDLPVGLGIENDFLISTDGKLLVYETSDTKLFAASLMANTQPQSNQQLANSIDFSLSNSGSHIVYLREQGAPGNQTRQHQLFSVRISQGGDFCIPIKAKNGNLSIVCL